MPSSFAPAIATPVAANLGGTGIANNAASTLAISGNFGTTFTVTGATALTLPTSGTLVTTTTLGNNTLAASVTTLTASTAVIIPLGLVGTTGLQFAGKPDTGLFFGGNAVNIVFGGQTCLSVNSAQIGFNANVSVAGTFQFQFEGNGSAASPSIFLDSSPFPGMFLNNGNGGTIGFSGNASTNHLLIQTSVGITTGLDLIVGSGKALQLGNAATTGLVAGALAALTNATIVIKDSTGQAYRVPCVI